MRLKENFIKKVAEELSNLNGSEFEALCRPFIEMLTGLEFELKGHNLEMKAVRGSVDLVEDEDYKVIGQCGTEKNYFTSDKPLDDIDSSNRNSPDYKMIYLFCNRRADSEDFSNTQVRIANKLTTQNKGQKYKLYDGQRIAKQIYEHRYLTEKIEEILTKLPGAYQYYLLFPQTNVLPILPSDYEERAEEDEVAKALAQTDFLQIYGLSGIGKSLLSISVANNISSQFDTILWFNGEDIDVQNLHSVKIQRMEGAVNLSSVLQMFKVLIIVDNLNTGVDELKKSFEKDNKKGSKCIVTSLQLNVAKERSFALTYVTDEVTRKILLNTELPPSDTQLEQLLKQVNGYPLLLELAKKAVSGGDMTWDDVINESNLTEINDLHRNEIFAQRIIGPLNIEHEVKLCENYGRIKAAQYLYGEYDQEYKEKLFKVAEYYHLRVPRDNDFIRRDIVNLYAAGNQADAALSYFEEIENKEDMFAQQSLSKVYYVKGEYDKALESAEKSVEAGKNVDIEYQAAFLHDKARALQKLNDGKAKDVMQEAIKKQTNDRVIKEWTEELQGWS